MAGEDLSCTVVVYAEAVDKSLLIVAFIFRAEIAEISLGIMKLFLCFFLGYSIRGEMVDDFFL